MDYEKKYKEALERAKAVLEIAANKEEAEGYVSTIFSELKESEDEKTRKYIIGVLEDLWQTCSKIEYDSTKIQNAIAWLEKQGKEDSSIQQAYEWGYTEGKRIERKHWVEKQKFSEDYNSIDPQFGKPIEQNPAWSEEDEEHYKACLQYFDEVNPDMVYYKDYQWLKSLKEKIGG